MNKKLIIKEYIQKIKLIKYYNKEYYDKNTTKITDAEFDDIKKK